MRTLCNDQFGLHLSLFDMTQPIDTWLDSLDLIEFVMECEKHFQITISDEAIESLSTFNDLVNLIANAIAK